MLNVERELTISSGAQNSNVVSLENIWVEAIEFPAAMTGTAVSVYGAGNTTSPSDSLPAFSALKLVVDEAGSAVSLSVQVGKIVALDRQGALWEAINSCAYLALQSDAAEAADRTIKLIGHART